MATHAASRSTTVRDDVDHDCRVGSDSADAHEHHTLPLASASGTAAVLRREIVRALRQAVVIGSVSRRGLRTRGDR